MEKLTNEFKIEYTKGDTYTLSIKFKNITEDLRTAYLTVKENPDDTTPLIQKSLGKGITKIDDRAYKNEKTYKVQLQPADTVNLEPKVQYLYDIQVTIENVVKTVLHGIFVLGSTITGTSQITTQDIEVEIDDELETELGTTPATTGVEYEQDPVACAEIGDMTKLETTNKDTLVKSINEVNTRAKTNTEDITKANVNITKANEEIAKANEEITNANEEITKANEEITKIKNGTTEVGKAQNANIAIYASDDTSKGTIEERLNKMGFNDSVSLNLGGTYAGELYRQGNLIHGHILPKLWSNLANITIPVNFRPKEVTTIVNCMISGNTYMAFIKTDGSISLEYSSGAIASSTWNDICVGYEASPIQ